MSACTLPSAARVLAGLCLLFLTGCASSSTLGNVFARDRAVLPYWRNPLHSKDSQADLAKTTTVAAPGMELEWQITAREAKPGLVPAGKSVVGPDGTVVFGPYGTYRVAGQGLEDVRAKVEKQLSGVMKQPTVKLAVAAKAEDPEDLAWQTVTPHGDAQTQGKRGGVMAVNYKGQAPPEKLAQAGHRVHAHSGPYPGPHPGVHGQLLIPAGAPEELNRVVLPPYVVGPPDVLDIEFLGDRMPQKIGLLTQPLRGPHLIRPDGTVSLGAYGAAQVTGLTVDQVRDVIAGIIHRRINKEDITFKMIFDAVNVDVLAYNSKVYYVITDGAGLGEQVYTFPITGSETVLDGISKIGGLPPVASKRHIWVARRTHAPGHDNILPVDWDAISRRAVTATNYQIMPGDRVYVRADGWRTADTFIAKILSPIERLFGASLLASQTINSIGNGTTFGSNNNTINTNR